MKRAFLLILFSPSFLLWADFGIQTQAELHSKYQNLDFGLQDVVVYARLEKATSLPRDWQLYLRLDVPYVWLWGKQQETISISDDGIVVPPESEGAHPVVRMVPLKEQGLGDILTRAFFVTPPLDCEGRFTLGFGSELTFPTAQDTDLGTGKYSARPLAGFKYDIPYLGSWFALLVKYQFSFAGDPNRTPFQIFYIQPVLIYEFKKDWALILTPECQYNIREKAWFIPASVNLTHNFTEHFSASVAYQRGLITDFPVFQDEAELIVRYAF